MADEVTDLTDEAKEAADGKGKKGKRKDKKKGKEPKDTVDSGDKDSKVKSDKKGGAGGVILLMSLVLLLLIGGFGTALFFDALGTRIVVGDAVNEHLQDIIIWLNPGYQSIAQRQRAEAAAQEGRFAERNAEIDAREAAILEREYMLDTFEAQTIRRENELLHREAQLEAMLDRTVPLHRRENMTEQEFNDMISLSITYAQMAPEEAANIMVEIHDPRDVAGLLYHMSERERAAIMTAMEARFAAHITEILLYY